MLIAITREVGPNLVACELSHVPRREIDPALAAVQHLRYRQALAGLGCEVLSLPAEPALPDAVFVEDVAVVLEEVAIMTRPGAMSRRGEGKAVAAILSRHRPLRTIRGPGTLDGGDVLRIGRTLYVGLSQRSDPAGIEQLRALLSDHGYTVQGLPVHDCLHLKSAVTQVADDTVLLQPAWTDRAPFADFRIIEVDPQEAHAANALRVGAGVVYPDCFPRTRKRLEQAGIAVTAVDVSELQKAEGAVTCCTLLFTPAPAL